MESLVLDCLAVDPDDRPDSIADVSARLAAAGTALGGGRSAPKSARAVGRRAAVAIAVAGIAAVGIAVLWLRPAAVGPGPASSPEVRASGVEPAPIARRPSVLWLGFPGSGGPLEGSAEPGDAAWLGAMVEASLLASLGAAGDIRLVADERAAEIRLELGDQLDTPAGDEPLRGELATRTGVDAVVRGVGAVDGGSDGDVFRFTVELSPGGAPISGRVATSQIGDFADEITRVADEIRARLGLGGGTRRQIEHARASTPLSMEARRAYAAGQEAARRFEYRRAAELLVESLRLEPDHPKVLHALSTAWGKLGFRVRAEEASRRAVENAAGLARHEQMALEAHLRMLERDWPRAEALYRALWEFFPDDATYGLGVLEAHDRSGDLAAALAAADVLRERFGPDPRIDLAVSHVAYHAGDWAASQEAAAKVVSRGVELGSPAIEATGLLQEAMTRLRTDQDLAPVERQLERGVALAESVGNRMRTGLGRIYQGDCASRRDRFEAAEAFYRRGIDELEAVGSVHVDRARASLAILLDR
ncbi:MAG: hypothetical protein AAFX50_15045, partial [Acidobacteriota bacterium]